MFGAMKSRHMIPDVLSERKVTIALLLSTPGHRWSVYWYSGSCSKILMKNVIVLMFSGYIVLAQMLDTVIAAAKKRHRVSGVSETW